MVWVQPPLTGAASPCPPSWCDEAHGLVQSLDLRKPRGKRRQLRGWATRGQRLVSSTASNSLQAGPESPLNPPCRWCRWGASSQPRRRDFLPVPTSPIPGGWGMTQTQAQASCWGLWGRHAQVCPGPHNLQEAPVSSVGVLPGPTSSFPSLLLRGAGLGWGLTVLVGFADASRGRDRNLRRETTSYIIPSSLPKALPIPAGYLGQLPLN